MCCFRAVCAEEVRTSTQMGTGKKYYTHHHASPWLLRILLVNGESEMVAQLDPPPQPLSDIIRLCRQPLQATSAQHAGPRTRVDRGIGTLLGRGGKVASWSGMAMAHNYKPQQ